MNMNKVFWSKPKTEHYLHLFINRVNVYSFHFHHAQSLLLGVHFVFLWTTQLYLWSFWRHRQPPSSCNGCAGTFLFLRK